ncbi:hypothetical protein ACFL35_05135 [Candidatus Riflebacteria bacterium]
MDPLYGIEVNLLEFLKDQFDCKSGLSWYNVCFSMEVLKKFKESGKYEKNSKSIKNFPLHLVYYFGFFHPGTVIEKENNWGHCFYYFVKENVKIVVENALL